MSQNGPHPGSSFPGGDADGQPYAEPADPWGDQPVSDPSWSVPPPSIPHQSAAHGSGGVLPSSGPANSSMWGQPARPAKRNTPIVALVIVLGVLVGVGLGATAWLLKVRPSNTDPASTDTARPSASVPADPGSAAQNKEDARFVKAGQCVVNRGTEARPVMQKSVCTSGTYEVLKRIDGPTTGEPDAKSKCSKVSGYTKWYFYDSSLDDLDFVLCLKERKAV
jgi:hypothetical protein